MLTQLHFCAIGFGHSICANKVYMVLNPNTKQAHRMVKDAKKEDRWLDATCRRPIKSVILMDDGKVIGCPFSCKTTLARLIRSTEDYISMVPQPGDDNDDEMEEEEYEGDLEEDDE